MRAAVLTSVNEPLEILEVDVDKPQANEVLIRTAAAGVCHSDMHFQEGKYPTECPIVLGHEGAGVVEAVGSDVRYVQPGDHVITCVSMSCGECRTCLRGKPYLCPHEGMNRAPDEKPRLSRNGDTIHQLTELSCYAEQMLVHEKAVVKVTEELPLDRAALIGCAVTTGVGAAQNTAGVGPGDRSLSVDGQSVGAFADLQRIVIASGGGEPVTMVLSDGASERETMLTAKMQPYPTPEGGIEMRPLIGVTAIPRLAPVTMICPAVAGSLILAPGAARRRLLAVRARSRGPR